MLSIFFSWIVIILSSLIWGYSILKIMYKDSKFSADVHIFAGLTMLTIYAQLFSIVHRVSSLAFLIMLLISLVLCIYLKMTTGYDLKVCLSELKGISVVRLIVGGAIVISIAVWTNGVPLHPDTAGYHQQSIAIVENYGVIKGIGNLHNRFAYNSSFIALQALFSFKWLLNNSMHTVNGFVICVILIYSICSSRIWDREELKASDYLKFAAIIYVFYDRKYISSPSTDTFPMLLILYICIKWCENIENHDGNVDRFAFLCILGGYAITLKLSAGACTLLIFYPLYQYIKEKNYIKIAKNGFLYIMILIPWMLRSIFISGYLVYPVTLVDIFNVEWKIPKTVAMYDNMEIKVFARGYLDVSKYRISFFEWMPIWIEHNKSIISRTIMLSGIISTLIMLIYIVYMLIRKEKKLEVIIIYIYTSLGTLMWLFTAPAIRFGIIYTLVNISILIGNLFQGRLEQKRFKNIYNNVNYILILVSVLFLSTLISSWVNIQENFYSQVNYKWGLTEEVKYDGFSVWFPVKDEDSEFDAVCSYDVFPCVLYKNMVDKVELIGNDISSGFKIKDEYKDYILKNDGETWNTTWEEIMQQRARIKS